MLRVETERQHGFQISTIQAYGSSGVERVYVVIELPAGDEQGMEAGGYKHVHP